MRSALRSGDALGIAALAILTIAGAFALGSSLVLLHGNWTAWYGPAEHGYLVLAASLWLALTAWREDPPLALRPCWWALMPFGTLVVLTAALELTFVNNSRLLLLPLIALTATALVFGREAAKRLFWPILFLYFALPQWWVINGLLQSVTTTAVTYALRWTGVPAFVDGNFVHLPSGTFQIASGCSGLNYLQAATALAAFHGLLSLSNWRNRFMAIVAAAAAAIAFNWVRVYAVVLVGHLSEMQHYLVTNEHHTFGWALFMVSMVPVFLFVSRLERREQLVIGAVRRSMNSNIHTSPFVVPAALAAAALLLLPVALEPAVVDPAGVTELPVTLGGRPRTTITSGWSPTFANANEDSAAFGSSSDAVEVYRAVYPRQTSEQRLLRPDNDFLGPEFRRLEQRRHTVSVDETGVVLELMEYRGTLRDRPRVVFAWYWVGGVQIAGTLEAKVAELRAVLAGRRDGVALALSGDCVPDCDSAQATLMKFASRHERDLRWPQPPP